MSDSPIKVHTESLDGSAPKTPVDGAPVEGHNQSSLRQSPTSGGPLKSLNLDAKTEGKSMTKSQKKMFMILGAVAIVAGVGTGYGAFRLKLKSGGDHSPAASQQVAGDVVNAGDVFGVKDDKTFKDSAEGYLAAGGVDGEGSHSLLREGGVSQTVYLTSSVTDLDKLVGMKVKVWGETFKGQKAGWLMDVGRVQVVETNAQSPASAGD